MDEALKQDITTFLMNVISHKTKRDKAVWIADVRLWFGIEEGKYEEELNEIYKLVLQRNGLMQLVND